jgi:hypothetical protein
MEVSQLHHLENIMKIMELLSLTHSSLSSFVTAISNQKIQGLKSRPKLLMEAIAKSEGLSVEALKVGLHKLHLDSYTFIKKEAAFGNDGGVSKLSGVTFTMSVNGVGRLYYIVVSGRVGDDGYVSDIIPLMHMPVVSIDGVDTNDVIRRMQLACNVASELCIYINKNKKVLTPHKMRLDGWSCNLEYGVGVSHQSLDDFCIGNLRSRVFEFHVNRNRVRGVAHAVSVPGSLPDTNHDKNESPVTRK